MAAKPNRIPDAGNKPEPVISARVPSCTRCGKRDAVEVAEGIPARMCQECRDYMAEHQRQYRSDGEIRARAQGFRDGVEAFRAVLVQRFAQVGSGLYMGHEAAAIVRQEKAPIS